MGDSPRPGPAPCSLQCGAASRPPGMQSSGQILRGERPTRTRASAWGMCFLSRAAPSARRCLDSAHSPAAAPRLAPRGDLLRSLSAMVQSWEPRSPRSSAPWRFLPLSRDAWGGHPGVPGRAPGTPAPLHSEPRLRAPGLALLRVCRCGREQRAPHCASCAVFGDYGVRRYRQL